MSRNGDSETSGLSSQGRWRPGRRRGQQSPGRHRTARRIAAWTAVGLVLVVVAAVLTGYVKYRQVWHSIKRVHVTDLGHRPPQYSHSAMNVLVIGSDSRSGKNHKFGASIQGQRSDTVMLLHLSPGRQHAVVLSLPRDSVAPVLGCQREPGFPGQQAQPGQIEQLNATFAFGGPGCLWKTVEQTTGIHIDHFIELNFTGFEKVVNDIGGVDVCLPWAISDPNSKLHLSKGMHHVWGAEALAFWRVRYIGEGSDLQRIRRDQYLMASLIHGIKRSDLLSSPARIYSVVTDAASAMTTDSGLSLGTLINIVESVRGLAPGSVQFIEAPAVAYPQNPNWVQWPQPQARRLFMAIAHDRSMPRTTRRAQTAAPSLASVSASQARVEVLNGSGVPGIAGRTAARLAKRGFNVVGSADAGRFNFSTSVIEYPGNAQLPAASTLAAQLKHVVLRQDPALATGMLRLIIGAGYTGLRASPARHAAAASKATAGSPAASASPSPSSPASSAVQSLSKRYDGITGNTNVCQDTSAFTGPDGHS
ncbi:MAG: LCP family protein [Streptosporangiaceae bacterium]